MRSYLGIKGWEMGDGVFTLAKNIAKSCGNAQENLRKACRMIVIKSVQKIVRKTRELKIVCTNIPKATFSPHIVRRFFHIENYAYHPVRIGFSASSTAPITTTTKLNKIERY